MANAGNAGEESLTQTLRLTVCVDLAKRERKCLLYSLVLWATCLTFIALPPESGPGQISPAFLERLFNEEQVQWNLTGRQGDRYRSILPELLYHYIKVQAQPIRSEVELRLENTDFTGVSISDNSLPIAPAGGSTRGTVKNNPSANERTEFARLNQIQHVLETQEFSRLDAQVVDFYRDYFLGFEAPVGSPLHAVGRESPPYGRIYEFEDGTCDERIVFTPPADAPEELQSVLEEITRDVNNNRTFCPVEIDSQGAFAFFEGVDLSGHRSLFQSIIEDNRLLRQKYANAYVYAQVYEVPLLPLDLRRSWIVWLLPVALAFVVLYARSLFGIRRELLQQIGAANGVRTHDMALLVSGDRRALRKYVGWSAGRLVGFREDWRGSVLFLLAILLAITPLSNIVTSGSEFGVDSLDDAEGLLPAVYVAMLKVVVVGVAVFLLVKAGLWSVSVVRRLLPRLAHVIEGIRRRVAATPWWGLRGQSSGTPTGVEERTSHAPGVDQDGVVVDKEKSPRPDA